MTRTNVQWVLLRLLMLIFLYSAVVKILDFGKFSSELAKSPFLQGTAGFMSMVVPGAEAIVTVLLLANKTRRIALYIYLYMMAAFLGYVYLMMKKAYYLPCACMGLFDSLGWGPHLAVNSLITGLVLMAIFLDKEKLINKDRYFKIRALKINPERLQPSGRAGYKS